MKMSDKKAATRRKIINQAVQLFSERGYEQTTMKQIAKAAEIGDATIYKYFPSKEQVLLGFLELRASDAIERAAATHEFEYFDLQEKLQLLIDTLLESLLVDREFVAFCMQKFSQSPLFMMQDALKVKVLFQQAMHGYLTAAQETGELTDIPFKGSISNLLGEYVFGVVFYWIKDDSEEFSNTTQMVDLSLGIVSVVLSSGLINKVSEFAGFMFKAHLFRMMSDSDGVLSMLKGLKLGMAGMRG
ncbi:MAG: hypothetical protein OFPI_38790 [Osedax symbiont Rs2]|nr:MAG: hypothetical protein OFPI_38790 [Osedax symbiont Rs2]